MIEEKLEKARLRSARRSRSIAISLLTVTAFCGLVMFGFIYFVFPTINSVQVTVSEKEDLALSDKMKIRGEFKEMLQQYETVLEPGLKSTNVESWGRDLFFDIRELKKKMMLSFANGEYTDAVDTLQLLKSKTERVLGEADRVLTENLEKATSFFNDDLYREAKIHIDKALMVAPQSQEAILLQQKNEKLPSLLPFLSQAEIARTENNLQKEHEALQKALDIAPDREGVADRLKTVAEQIKAQTFDAHISSGFAALEKRQTQKARYHYQEAGKVDSERTELRMLSRRLVEMETSLRVQQAVRQAELAIQRDDWDQARKNFARAAQDAPENKEVAEGLRQADQIFLLLSDFSQYFSDPYRLTNTDFRILAEKTLAQAEVLSGVSFTIKNKTGQLRELIDKLNRLIPVTVNSDNKTYVSVRGVGKAGVFYQKTIQLKPGKYILEGARDGFKSKLVHLFIPYDEKKISVRVMSDEPI
ncbi:MAG: hypothetical protein WBB19_07615 [Desulforhopalus sp.]